ncbi:MAG: DMT family transporter [Phascolarctobacterium sp.]|nr:DMT family transporter [Phascolarctobacterium sp.]
MKKKEENKTTFKGILSLTICALIWGTAFVAQSIGAKFAEPFTLNWARSLLSSIFLIFVIFLFDKFHRKAFSILGSTDINIRKKLLKGGLISGIMLTTASFFQQFGVMNTSVGKAGFITALYIVLVPLFAFLIFKKKISKLQIFSIGVAMIAMYFISITEEFTITKGDFLILVCAFFFAWQILSVDYFSEGLDGIRYSMLMFVTCTILNAVLMFIFEKPSLALILEGWAPILYLGVMSSGIAYTLQIVGQQYCNPLLACMLMSLESVFALVSGWLVLGQTMSGREIFGCCLLLTAIIMAQAPSKN